MKKLLICVIIMQLSFALFASATEKYEFNGEPFLLTENGVIENPDFDFEAFDREIMAQIENTPEGWDDGYENGLDEGYSEGWDDGYEEASYELYEEIESLEEKIYSLNGENEELTEELRSKKDRNSTLVILLIISLLFNFLFGKIIYGK